MNKDEFEGVDDTVIVSVRDKKEKDRQRVETLG